MSWQSIIFILILVLFAICLFLVQHYYHVRLRNEIGRAQRSERIKTVFMANVSHALRTPLNAIITDSQKLLDNEESDPKKLKAMMATINQNGKQLLYFISQLLELSSFDSNMATFTLIEVNLAELIASYRRETQRDAGANVQVVVRSPLSPHAKGMVDTNLMYQLMTHLLHNALAHTQEGTITIDYDYADNGLKIEVIDTGDGETVSTKEIKKALKELIDNEPQGKPLSDIRLAAELKKRLVLVATNLPGKTGRAVSKYGYRALSRILGLN